MTADLNADMATPRGSDAASTLTTVRAELAQRTAELAIITTINHALSAEVDLDALIALTGDQIRQTFNADIAYLALYDREAGVITFPYAYGETIDPLPFGQGLASQIITTGQPLLINSATARAARESNQDVVGTFVRSYLGVPILAARQPIGVVSVQSIAEDGRFGEAETRLLSTIAASVGAAIQNTRLVQERERRLREVSALQDIVAAATSTLDLQEVLERLHAELGRVIDVRTSLIALYDKQTNVLTYPLAYDSGVRVDLTPALVGNGTNAWVVANRQPLLLHSDAEAQALGLATDDGRVGVENAVEESFLVAPMLHGDRLLGIINIQSYQQFAFTEDDLRFVTAVASQAAVAVHNAQLFTAARRRAEETAVLAEVGRDISATLDLPIVLERIAGHARSLLSADSSAVFLPDTSGQTFRAITALGLDAEAVRNAIITLGEGIIGDLAQRRVAEIINNPNIDPRARTIPGSDDQDDERMMVAPLLAGERLVGMMVVWRLSSHDHFISTDLQFLRGLAGQAAIAIENARLYAEAAEARAAAEQANMAKSSFLANMSHELRTPLNAILGFTRIVRRKSQGLLPDKQLENLDKVLTSSEHLLGLINTVLDIAKIEAGRMDVHTSPVDIASLIAACTATTQPLLRPEVSLRQHVAELEPVRTDQEKLKQILINLLSNAAKFTHAGTITVTATAQGDTLHIDVADTGIGIAPTALGTIFEQFRQAESGTTRQYGGTGLGLSISRHLARLLGGDLTVQSAPGAGSVFTLALPRGTDLPPPSVSETAHLGATSVQTDGAPMVLAIDDDPQVHDLLRQLLGEAGYQVVSALDGADGLRQARTLQPQAITLDIMLPVMDGWQILHALKADPLTQTIPVIIVSIVDRQALGFQLGATDYLPKPLDGQSLLHTLTRLIPPLTHPEGRRLLLADDDPQVHDLVQQLLGDQGYTITVAVDGEAALAGLEQGTFDVLLLDLLMPRLDGFEVIARLRGQPAYANLPIIVLTARDISAAEAAALTPRVSYILRKQGLAADTLVQTLRQVLVPENGGGDD